MSRNFPSFINGFLEYSENLGAPKKFLLWSAISGISAALERKTWVTYNGLQVVYPNTYVMLVAESGIAKKSTATRAMTEIIYEVPTIMTMSTQLSAASLVEQLKEAGDQKDFNFNNIKYKNSSLFAYSSEAKVTIGDQKGLSGIQELLTDFYDCGDPNIWSDKKGWNKRTLSGGNITIYNPCLNLLACSTPAWLNEAIGKTGIEGGFASRVLFVTQKDREKTVGWLDDDDSVKEKASIKMKERLAADLRKIHKLQGRYRTTTGWRETYNEIELSVNAKLDSSGEMKSYYSRKMWHCLKLAQILAADQSDELILTPEHLIKAKELLEMIEPDMYSAFASKGENKNLTSLTLVWDVMRKRPEWSKTNLKNATFKHANGAQFDDHMKTLREMGKIMPVMHEGGIYYKVIDQTPLGSR